MTNSLTKTTKLSREIILDQVMKIILDHSIEISQESLRKKINILFEDCKDMTAERFIANCDLLRSQEMFGKIPASFKFKDPIPDDKKSEYQKWKERNGR